jgi:Fe-S cluster biogenesis protein NfuA
MTPDWKGRLEKVLAEEVGPALQLDGAAIELVDFSDGVLQLRLGNVCASCPSTIMVVIMGLEQELRQRFPEIEYLEAVV